MTSAGLAPPTDLRITRIAK